MALAVSPDGARLLVATDKNRLALYDRGSGQYLCSFYGADNDSFSQPCCAFHPGGAHVLASSQSHAVLVWRVATQRQVAALKGHTATVRSLSFTPAGTLVTAGFDRSVRLWPAVADLRLFGDERDNDDDEEEEEEEAEEHDPEAGGQGEH
jgi:WD40 repeat protein